MLRDEQIAPHRAGVENSPVMDGLVNMADVGKLVETAGMEMEHDKLVRRPSDNVQLSGSGPDSKAQMQLAVVSLVVDLVRMGAEEAKARADDDRKWEDVHRKIALLDRESETRLKGMEHQLRVIGSRTDRLRLVLRTATELDRDRLELLGGALSKAIEQLTLDPE